MVTDSGRAVIKLVRASAEEVRRREEELLEDKRKAIRDAAGFAAVMDIIRESGKPAVGHNLAFDVAYSLHCFVSPLPPTWEEYRKLVQWQFPGGIFDTKHIAIQLFSDSPEPVDTGLGALFSLLTVGHSGSPGSQDLIDAIGIDPRDDLVVHEKGFDHYANVKPGECAHEAGYDAFMTGTVFACLINFAAKDSEVKSSMDMSRSYEVIESMVWRMHVTKSDLKFASFAGPEELPLREHILYVSDIPEDKQKRRGHEMVRYMTQNGLNGARATILENGAKALIEFPDADVAATSGRKLLEAILPGAKIEGYVSFREEIRIKREQIISARRGANRFRPRISAADGQKSSRKRPRPENDSDNYDKGTKCTLM